MPQRYKLYVANTNFYIVEIYKWPSKFGAPGCAPAGAFFPAKIHLLYFINRESSVLCLEYINRGLSKPCAPGCAPAGAFFLSKIYLLYFINREPLFLGHAV